MLENEQQEPLGKRIRQFFRDLLGSRVAEHLEIELLRLRQDFEQRLLDQGLIIASLREEKQMLMSKITAYEFAVMPRTSRAGAEVIAYQKPVAPKPNFSFVDIPPTKSRWQVVQEEHEERMRKELEEESAAAAAKAKE